ncbi:MAG TPA: type II toxin-antitoxin system prevent-host-death family antitoxin [bacterium]|nr:type II toxin-antitoxin system prevent-host-death family antitoxin [bacterium]
MNRIVSVAELKRHLSEVLGEVAHAQQSVLVTRHGRPVARLVPVEAKVRSLADVAGWLEDRDAFFRYLDEAARNRRRHTPRVLKSS